MMLKSSILLFYLIPASLALNVSGIINTNDNSDFEDSKKSEPDLSLSQNSNGTYVLKLWEKFQEISTKKPEPNVLSNQNGTLVSMSVNLNNSDYNKTMEESRKKEKGPELVVKKSAKGSEIYMVTTTSAPNITDYNQYKSEISKGAIIINESSTTPTSDDKSKDALGPSKYNKGKAFLYKNIPLIVGFSVCAMWEIRHW